VCPRIWGKAPEPLLESPFVDGGIGTLEPVGVGEPRSTLGFGARAPEWLLELPFVDSRSHKCGLLSS
jgi:hypothetical protein